MTIRQQHWHRLRVWPAAKTETASRSLARIRSFGRQFAPGYHSTSGQDPEQIGHLASAAALVGGWRSGAYERATWTREIGANGRAAEAEGESNTCQAIGKWPAASGGSKCRQNRPDYYLHTSCIMGPRSQHQAGHRAGSFRELHDNCRRLVRLAATSSSGKLAGS